MSKSKDIGKRTERAIAQWLNSIYKDFEGVEFKRVIGSGAHAHRMYSLPYEIQVSLHGDVFGHTDFPFVVECKRRTNENIGNIFSSEKHEINEWINQVASETERLNSHNSLQLKKFPMLVMDFGGLKKTWVAIDDEAAEILQKTVVNLYKNPYLHYRYKSNKSYFIFQLPKFSEIMNQDLSIEKGFLVPRSAKNVSTVK